MAIDDGTSIDQTFFAPFDYIEAMEKKKGAEAPFSSHSSAKLEKKAAGSSSSSGGADTGAGFGGAD